MTLCDVFGAIAQSNFQFSGKLFTKTSSNINTYIHQREWVMNETAIKTYLTKLPFEIWSNLNCIYFINT